LFAGDTDGSVSWVNDAFARARASKYNGKATSVLERVRGHALMQRGDYANARKALEASLASARARSDLQDIMLALHSMVEACRREGTEAPPDVAAELDSLVTQLAVRALPPVP